MLDAEHYADDLALILEDGMEDSFHARLEDGSPYEVWASHVLVKHFLLTTPGNCKRTKSIVRSGLVS